MLTSSVVFIYIAIGLAMSVMEMRFIKNSHDMWDKIIFLCMDHFKIDDFDKAERIFMTINGISWATLWPLIIIRRMR